MQNVDTGFKHKMEGGSSADVVAKAVIEAVTNENPSLRYLAGKDVETWIERKRNMSDEEFYKMMKRAYELWPYDASDGSPSRVMLISGCWFLSIPSDLRY